MSHALIMPRRDGRIGYGSLVSTDSVIAGLFIVIYAIVIHLFAYHGAFAESDLYRVLVGLLDGQVSGRGIASPLHYDRDFGFGYLASFYAFANPAVLRDPDRLMALMNQIGFWSMIPGLVFFWSGIRLVHGPRAATVALVVFALGPMNPEVFTSGHQSIPMFALLMAAAVLLFLPVTGWKAVLASAGAFLLLLAGITTRGEIFLAFPWLVLARVDTRSLRSFLVSGVLRAIAPAAVLIVFVVLQRHLQSIVHAKLGAAVGTYFLESYSWITVAPGLVYMALGCGIVTVMAAAAAAAYYCWRNLFGRKPSLAPWAGELLGPLALILVPLVFFIPNPVPTRHFMTALAGMAILIGIVLARSPALGRVAALGIALAIGVGNQVMAEAVRPALLRINQAHSPYVPVPEAYPIATHANLGWEWRRHATLVMRRERWNALGNKIRTSCDAHLFVLSDEFEQLFSRLYTGGTPVKASRVDILLNPASAATRSKPSDDVHMALVGQGAARLPGMRGEVDGKTFIMAAKEHAWPADAVAAILADPSYNDYKIVADPYTMSTFDRTPIPADRTPSFGCAVEAPTR